MEQETSQSTTPNQRRTGSRRSLNPFLRKPLWVILDETQQQQQQSSTTEINAISSSRSGSDDSNGIELPQRNNDERIDEGLSFDYHEDHNDQHDIPLTSEQSITQSQQQEQNPHHHHHHVHHHTVNTLPPRHLTLFDLVSIGVGGTIGSGIFVLNGLIAHQYAGPATFLSWSISGMAALLSGCCYAELSGRIPSAGSSYAYAFVALGELPAFVTAGMLTLEFLLSGSAVARSWGDKVVEWLRVELNANENILQLLEPGYGINPAACLVSIATTLLVMGGVKESKLVTDIFTWLKVFLVVFMTIGGFALFDRSNFTPFVPPEFGTSGVLRGAVSSFFGYLGFDAVCCVAGEAIQPERNLPLSIMITLGVVTTLYVLAAISLVGMQSYEEISPESGFPEAFKANGIEWASQLTAFGEVFTLPVVVLISVIIQPRLQCALANDGLLPPMFGELDATGNPRKGAMFAGVLMVCFATFVPFSYLDDFVSAGILIAFTVTNCSLIIMRRESPESDPKLLPKLLVWFNLFSFVTCLTLSHGTQSPVGWAFASLAGCVSIFIATNISRKCPPASTFGHATGKASQIYGSKKYFSTPLVPYVPCLGMFANYFLISQLSFFGIGLLFMYTLFAVLMYFVYGAHNSVGRIEGWEDEQYAMVEEHDNRSPLTGSDAVIT